MTSRLLATLSLAASLAFAQSALAQAAGTRVVLKGYDPVAYFTEGKPVKGDPRHSFDFDDARYHFASARHRDMFVGDPEKYAPQFGGFCTGSMSRGVRNEGDPQAWVINDGRLYVFGHPKFVDVAAKDPAYLPTKAAGAAGHWRRGK